MSIELSWWDVVLAIWIIGLVGRNVYLKRRIDSLDATANSLISRVYRNAPRPANGEAVAVVSDQPASPHGRTYVTADGETTTCVFNRGCVARPDVLADCVANGCLVDRRACGD